MPDNVKLTLMPTGVELEIERGTPLREILFAWGVEFPCAGRRTCKRCRIKVLDGELPVSPSDDGLSAEEIEAGIRLACCHRIDGDLVLEVFQGKASILADDRRFSFQPQAGLGIAIDIGTTTVAGQLLDLQSGQVLAVQTGLNAQAQHGADVMSRISYAVTDHGQPELERLIRNQIETMIIDLIAAPTDKRELTQVILVGNTPMHNLFCGIDVTPLSAYPFHPHDDRLQQFKAAALGWQIPGNPTVSFLPGLGSFVGSDILAGMIATGFHHGEGLRVFVDLGTNGEMIVARGDRLLCASTAAGPAFEAATISQGMQATSGAIHEVELQDGELVCRVLGNGVPRGICGSGLVDAVAALLELRQVNSMGRIVTGAGAIDLAAPVRLSANDVRELQLAKGAIAVGIRLLVEQLGGRLEEIEQLLVAGAFGNFIRLPSARRIGLFHTPLDRIQAVGNTALLGAKRALFNGGDVAGVYQDILARIEHVALNTDPKFQDYYIDELMFPN